MTAFPDSLARDDGRTTLVELVPWAGPLQDQAGERARQMAEELSSDERVTALTITDNAGGFVRLGPLTLGQAIAHMGGEVVVHLACRDRNRAALQSTAYGLASDGLTSVLALSGDYPKEGFGGRSRPVFDIDSVALITLLRDLSDHGPHFTIGCAVNPFKALEADLVPQYLKLAMKVRAGADLAITQVGYDARAWSELMTWNRAQGPGIPLMASVYILSRPVANVFHRDGVPGIRLSDDLLAWVERQAASADKGRAAFLELAAKQVAVLRGLGYAGAYLAGQRSSAEIDTVLRLADDFTPDWRALLPDIHFPEPVPHRLFEPGDLPQLASDRPTRPSRTRRVPLAYRFNRLVHDVAFDPDSRGFAAARSVYGRLEQAHLMWPAHVLEQAVKIPLFDCKDCGDCSLPDIAYQCPEGACAKNQRNGPCGGSIDGECEVPGKRCVWTNAYERLRPYGEAMTMLEREPVIQDNALRGTSAWANTYLGRDHYRHHTGGDS
ncbi:MAG TPA: methylenetetrahydrofolate reductase C-terminal domain-containing protein [Anaerolineae bacterium]|nr:methylenetetrahydrofolate reductase C-terminal domain-containing protein [Anaerolineae bacterium]